MKPLSAGSGGHHHHAQTGAAPSKGGGGYGHFGSASKSRKKSGGGGGSREQQMREDQQQLLSGSVAAGIMRGTPGRQKGGSGGSGIFPNSSGGTRQKGGGGGSGGSGVFPNSSSGTRQRGSGGSGVFPNSSATPGKAGRRQRPSGGGSRSVTKGDHVFRGESSGTQSANKMPQVIVTPARQTTRHREQEMPNTAPQMRTGGSGDRGMLGLGPQFGGSSVSSVATPTRLASKDTNKYVGVRRVIQELNKAIGHEKRIAAITNACAEFDHWDETKHNAELHLGSANVLSLLLSMTDDDDEIRMICAALEMVFRAGTDVLKSSFYEVGAAVVPMLLRLLERCESGSMKHADVSILNITKALLYFSRVPDLRVPLARHQGLLEALVRVATSILNPECRVMRMRVLANLANSEENKVTMLEHTGLVESILKIAALDLCDGAREYASAALMDLASSPLNQPPMARNDKLLGTLVKLSVIDDRAETREYAVTALQNLAFSKENRRRLATYGSGVVLEALKKTVSSDPNDKARRRAAGALTNLACEETADRLGCHKGLLETLSEVSTRDTHNDVQQRAALALTKIATSITVSMSCFPTLLDALVVTAVSRHTHGAAAVMRVKARMPENREIMAHHAGVLEALAAIIVDRDHRGYDAKDRENCMRAVMHLTNEGRNQRKMCNKLVLDALVAGAALEGTEHEDTRDSAIIAMERLATEHSNRRYMARHPGLLVAVAKATEREAKAELSGEEKQPGQAHLAKPLLMSLLVAM